MTDRELLELAARAAGIKINAARQAERDALNVENAGLWTTTTTNWNPLTSDGDALRLAVKLGIQVTPFLSGACKVETIDGWIRTECGYETADAAARRAITRAAAEIGRSSTNPNKEAPTP